MTNEIKLITAEIKLITADLLNSWNACRDGYNKFCELFPEGADLKTAVNSLMENGHHYFACWLFKQFFTKGLFEEVKKNGNGNTEKRKINTGEHNDGIFNSGAWNIGHNNSGSWNKGNGNSGDRNSGNWNKGDDNEGFFNVGNGNSGLSNTGSGNVGDDNTGDCNEGDRNSGNWNKGDDNEGFFNVGNTPDEILIFNKLCKRVDWRDAYKPMFLYFKVTEEDKDYIDRFGREQLKVLGYKEAFKKSWDNADPEDRIRIKELPNFDAEIFFEISGIDLR